MLLAQNHGRNGQTQGTGNSDYSADRLAGFSDLVILAQHSGKSLATPPAGISFAAATGRAVSKKDGKASVETDVLH